MTDIEKHFYDTMIQRLKDMEEERAKKEIHPSVIVMGEDHFCSLERQQITKCDHPHQWGGLSVGGVKVFSSPHLPPDTMLMIDDSAMKDVWPALSMPFNPHEPRRPEWEPNFDALLAATHRTLLTNNRGRFNTILLVDDSPLLPGGEALAKFRSDRKRLMCRLEIVFCKTFYRELRRLGKPCPMINLPTPPFKSASQTRAAAQKAKAKARRKALRFRKRSNKASQTA